MLELEEFAFELLNTLADDYGVFDNGSFTNAIWTATTEEELQIVIDRLQLYLLLHMEPVF